MTTPSPATLAELALLLSGIDSLYVSFYVDFSKGGIDFEELAYQRERLKAQRGDRLAEIQLGSETFALKPYGSRPYGFVLGNADFTLKLGEHTQPSCYVQFSSEALWRDGWQALCERFRQWVASVGGIMVQQESVSRCDLAFDYHAPGLALAPEYVVSRAAKLATYLEHGKLQTLTVGRDAVVVRIYDKCAEIEQQSGKAWLYELWGRTSDVWRVEFQVRGDRLRAGGIDSLDDLRDHQGDLLAELASRHTTLRLPNGDSNRSRWPLHPLWRAVQRDIAVLPRLGLVRAIDPQTVLQWRQRALARAMYGLLKAYGAIDQLRRGETEEVQPLWIILRRLEVYLSEQQHDHVHWPQDILRRIRDHELGQW